MTKKALGAIVVGPHEGAFTRQPNGATGNLRTPLEREKETNF